MTAKLIDDCFRPDDPVNDRMRSHGDTIAALKARMQPITSGHETVSLTDLPGRILSESVRAGRAVPGHDNSAVDGYAFSHPGAAFAEKVAGQRHTFQLAGRSAAGHPMAAGVPAGAAASILTGAVVPDGADTVAMQEDCTHDDAAGSVTVPAGLKPGANIRRSGEDVNADDLLFDAGHVVRPQDLAALASVGRADAMCHRKLSVAVLSTGDELIAPGTAELASGQVYDANAATLAALVQTAGASAVLGQDIVPDDAILVRERLRAHANRQDVIITSGGASKGSEDHMAAAVADLGSRYHWQINIKPGRPILFGQIDGTPVIGLPGNPVAAFVCFLLYVFPMLRVLGGARWPEPRRFCLPAGFDFKGRKQGRREYWRGWIERAAAGQMIARKFPRDGSGLISGLRAADALIEIGEDHGDIAAGDPVSVIPLSEYGIVA